MLRVANAGINNSVCDKCIEEEKPKEQTGFFNDNILLPVYYKRKIEITFQKSESKDIANKYVQLYTVFMIPNMENWLKEKLEETKKKMEKNGLEKVEFKLIGRYSEMHDTDIENYSTQDCSAIYFGYKSIWLSFVAQRNDSREEKFYKNFWTGIKSMVKDMDWINVIINILTVIVIIILLVFGGVSLVAFVGEIIDGHYSHLFGPFVLFVMSVFGSWAMIKILKDNF